MNIQFSHDTIEVNNSIEEYWHKPESLELDGVFYTYDKLLSATEGSCVTRLRNANGRALVCKETSVCEVEGLLAGQEVQHSLNLPEDQIQRLLEVQRIKRGRERRCFAVLNFIEGQTAQVKFDKMEDFHTDRIRLLVSMVSDILPTLKAISEADAAYRDLHGNNIVFSPNGKAVLIDPDELRFIRGKNCLPGSIHYRDRQEPSLNYMYCVPPETDDRNQDGYVANSDLYTLAGNAIYLLRKDIAKIWTSRRANSPFIKIVPYRHVRRRDGMVLEGKHRYRQIGRTDITDILHQLLFVEEINNPRYSQEAKKDLKRLIEFIIGGLKHDPNERLSFNDAIQIFE